MYNVKTRTGNPAGKEKKKMKKAIFKIDFNYTFDASRKGAKHSLDGEHWFNGGNFIELSIRNGFGYGLYYDTACTAFDAGSDIEELHMSVKSSKASLSSEILGKDLESSLDCYFERTASTSWAWGIVIEDTAQAYIMDAKEFRSFCETWASYQQDRKTVRFKATSGKMIQWLEERL